MLSTSQNNLVTPVQSTSSLTSLEKSTAVQLNSAGIEMDYQQLEAEFKAKPLYGINLPPLDRKSFEPGLSFEPVVQSFDRSSFASVMFSVEVKARELAQDNSTHPAHDAAKHMRNFLSARSQLVSWQYAHNAIFEPEWLEKSLLEAKKGKQLTKPVASALDVFYEKAQDLCKDLVRRVMWVSQLLEKANKPFDAEFAIKVIAADREWAEAANKMTREADGKITEMISDKERLAAQIAKIAADTEAALKKARETGVEMTPVEVAKISYKIKEDIIKTQRITTKEFEEFRERQIKGIGWPHSSELRAVIEDAGFVYKPMLIRRDRCICETCGVDFSGWRSWHNPESLHNFPHPIVAKSFKQLETAFKTRPFKYIKLPPLVKEIKGIALSFEPAIKSRDASINAKSMFNIETQARMLAAIDAHPASAAAKQMLNVLNTTSQLIGWQHIQDYFLDPALYEKDLWETVKGSGYVSKKAVPSAIDVLSQRGRDLCKDLTRRMQWLLQITQQSDITAELIIKTIAVDSDWLAVANKLLTEIKSTTEELLKQNEGKFNEYKNKYYKPLKKGLFWPHSLQFFEEIKAAGFYYDPTLLERDRCACKTCGVKVSGWRSWHDAQSLHDKKIAHPNLLLKAGAQTAVADKKLSAVPAAVIDAPQPLTVSAKRRPAKDENFIRCFLNNPLRDLDVKPRPAEAAPVFSISKSEKRKVNKKIITSEPSLLLKDEKSEINQLAQTIQSLEAKLTSAHALVGQYSQFIASNLQSKHSKTYLDKKQAEKNTEKLTKILSVYQHKDDRYQYSVAAATLDEYQKNIKTVTDHLAQITEMEQSLVEIVERIKKDKAPSKPIEVAVAEKVTSKKLSKKELLAEKRRQQEEHKLTRPKPVLAPKVAPSLQKAAPKPQIKFEVAPPKTFSSESKAQRQALNNAFNHLIDLKVCLVDFSSYTAASAEAAELNSTIQHYAVLFYITRIMQELKQYRALNSTALNVDLVTYLRNMIMHGSWEAKENAVLDTAANITENFPNELLALRKKHLTQRVLTEKQQRELVDLYELTNDSSTYLYSPFPLLISDTKLYRDLEKYHESKTTTGFSKPELLNNVRGIITKIGRIMLYVNKGYNTVTDKNRNEVLTALVFHLDALKMLIATFGELSRHLPRQIILPKEVVSLAQHIRNQVGHFYKHSPEEIISLSNQLAKINVHIFKEEKKVSAWAALQPVADVKSTAAILSATLAASAASPLVGPVKKVDSAPVIVKKAKQKMKPVAAPLVSALIVDVPSSAQAVTHSVQDANPVPKLQVLDDSKSTAASLTSSVIINAPSTQSSTQNVNVMLLDVKSEKLKAPKSSDSKSTTALLASALVTSTKNQAQNSSALESDFKVLAKEARQLYQQGLQYLKGNERDISKALQCLKTAAKVGNADANFTLGLTYYAGKDVERDFDEAINYFSAAAEKGHSMAQDNLIKMCIDNYGRAQYRNEAVVVFTQLANQGSLTAAYHLGQIYEKGLCGQTCDSVKAKKYYESAGKQAAEVTRKAYSAE